MSSGIASPPIRVASSDAIWNVEIPRATSIRACAMGLPASRAMSSANCVLAGLDLGRDAGEDRLSFVARAPAQTLERTHARDDGFFGERLVRLHDAADLAAGPGVTDGVPRALLDAA